jgi:hypothetical protein
MEALICAISASGPVSNRPPHKLFAAFFAFAGLVCGALVRAVRPRSGADGERVLVGLVRDDLVEDMDGNSMRFTQKNGSGR